MDSIARFTLDNQDKSKITRDNYARFVRTLAQAYPGKSVDDLTEEEVKLFLAGYENPSSWNTMMLTIRRFYESIGKKYLQEYTSRKAPQRVDFLQVKEEHITWLLQATRNARDKAMLAVMCDCGFRKGEIRKIRVGDVQPDQYGVQITCPNGKTGPRTVQGRTCTADLIAWLNQHPKREDPRAALFCNIAESAAFDRVYNGRMKHVEAVHLGDPLKEFAINEIIKSVLARARKLHPDLPHFYPHMARHYAATTAATRLRMNTQNLKQRFGWHSNTMPDVYCHVTGGDANQAYLEGMGVKVEKIVPTELICPRCRSPNSKANKYCGVCSTPLTEEVAQKLEEKKEELTAFQQDPDVLAEITKRIKADILSQLSKDPDVLKALLAAKGA